MVIVKDYEQKKFYKKGGLVHVRVGDEATANDLSITQLTITTTASQVEFETSGDYIIFHQTYGSKVYFGDEGVDTTFPVLESNDTLEISCKSDLQLWLQAESGSITVYLMKAGRE